MKFSVEDLIDQGLVKKKTYTEGVFEGLSVLKYKNNVFWDNLWSTDSRLLECRGMVVDAEDNIIIWPFTKIFNRFENGKDVDPNKVVIEVEKKNGFMAAATVYKGKWLVSTTGTLDSDFAKLAEEVINFNINPELIKDDLWQNLTLMFEICDPSDPHIIEEESGAYLIGARWKENGHMISESGLDGICLPNWKRPNWRQCLFSDVVKEVSKCRHEGFIVRDAETEELLLKIKSPYYLTKKFLIRGGVKKCDVIWDNHAKIKQIVEEEYYPLVDFIKAKLSKNEWLEMDEQTRAGVVNDYFKEK